jgi:hypothetical protein
MGDLAEGQEILSKGRGTSVLHLTFTGYKPCACSQLLVLFWVPG